MSVDILREAVIFKGLNETQLGEVASIAKIERHVAGTYLFNEDEQSTCIYIVEEGKISLQLAVGHRSNKITVETISKGDAVGWSIFLEPSRYSFSALCAEDSKVIVLDGVKFRKLLDQDKALGLVVMKRIIEILLFRFKNTKAQLVTEIEMAQLKSKGGTLL
jgi:CRP-like cAMP-binding protein